MCCRERLHHRAVAASVNRGQPWTQKLIRKWVPWAHSYTKADSAFLWVSWEWKCPQKALWKENVPLGSLIAVLWVPEQGMQQSCSCSRGNAKIVYLYLAQCCIHSNSLCNKRNNTNLFRISGVFKWSRGIDIFYKLICNQEICGSIVYNENNFK